jgi:hypothetical protein
MDNETLAQILEELRRIRQDVLYLVEREQDRQKALREDTEDAARRALGLDTSTPKALAARIKRKQLE